MENENYDPELRQYQDQGIDDQQPPDEPTNEMVDQAIQELPPKLIDRIVDKLGYVPKAQIEAANKRVTDNQTAFRTTNEKLRQLEDKYSELTKRYSDPQKDNETVLFSKWQESGDPRDYAAFQSVHDENLIGNLKKTIAESLGQHTQQVDQTINNQKYLSRMDEVLTKPEFNGITRDMIDSHFAENATPEPEEEAFIFLARQAVASGKAKDIVSFARGFNGADQRRSAPGATTPNASRGNSRLPDYKNVNVATMSEKQYEQYRKTVPELNNN